MILSYRTVEKGDQLDRVVLTESSAKYQTGMARSLVESMITRYTRKGAMAVLRSWKNGYVSISEISE